MVTRLAGMLRRVLGEDVRIETDFAPESSAVLADPGLLEQVLMNLAVNARDAMPEGGTLYLRTSTLEIDAASSLGGRPLAPGTYVSIVVEDTGIGMAADVVDKIFEAFYTTKQEGTGLGLAIVLGIVEQLGGDVRVESAPGWGSCFTVLLPSVDVRSVAAAQANGDVMPVRSLPRGTESILLVEDEASVRLAVRRMLEHLGYTVQDAASGAELLGVAASLPKPPDLVLTDVIMPGLNGRAVAERMLERWPEIKVLYMSGYTQDELHRQGLLPSEVDLLEKPITIEAMGHAVRRTLDGAKAA
jgi:CheY-like chemotaxis protein